MAPQKSCMSEFLGHQVHSLHTGALNPTSATCWGQPTLCCWSTLGYPMLRAAGALGKNFLLTV